MAVQEPTLGTEHLLPFERTEADSPADAGENLLEADASQEDTAGDEEQQEPEAEAEGASEEEEPEDDGDEGEGEDAEAEVDHEAPEARKHKFRADDQDYEVTYDELLRHASAGVAFTRKTQEVSNQRKAVEAKDRALDAERQQYIAGIEQLEAALAADQPKKPDEALRRENPGEYAAQSEDYRRWEEKRDGLKAERERTQEAMRARVERERRDLLAAETEKLVAALPEWRDENKAKAEMGRLVEFAGSLGMDEAYLDSVVDHRFVLLLRDSMLYRELQTKGKEKVREKAKAAPVLQPGGRPQNPKQGVKKAQQRAIRDAFKSGSIERMVEAFHPDAA
jgi:hypothetical protein